jgi:hypothetical protein
LEVFAFVEVPLSVGLSHTIDIGSRGRLLMFMQSSWNEDHDE